jgi:1-acyl-sn-glycerol-3-phosphate acyltransferase
VYNLICATGTAEHSVVTERILFNDSRVMSMSILRLLQNYMLAVLLLIFGRIVALLFIRIRVEGAENVPHDGPLIVTANHFSWFDAPLLTLYLPDRPAFMVASESQRFWFVRLYMRAFNGIPIWRGQVDRQAFQRALFRLREGKSVGIFPEGGIDPRLREARMRGELINDSNDDYTTHSSRLDAQLTRPQPGTAYLALWSRAPILPVGLIGTEQILGNILRLRRTTVTMKIGRAFGPLELEPTLNKSERRQRMDMMAEEIMIRIAELFPPENRGPYRQLGAHPGL